MKYPKYNGKQFDDLTKKSFDFWRKQFQSSIKISNQKLTKEQIDVLSWNCAFTVVTNKK